MITYNTATLLMVMQVLVVNHSGDLLPHLHNRYEPLSKEKKR